MLRLRIAMLLGGVVGFSTFAGVGWGAPNGQDAQAAQPPPSKQAAQSSPYAQPAQTSPYTPPAQTPPYKQPDQNSPDAQPSQSSPYKLQVYSRAVLIDVAVTDKKGNPVTGLTESDFQVYDNGKPQRLASFEEHREQAAKLETVSTAPGSFSNAFLRHPPPQVNVLLFDTTSIEIVDQMFLFQEMKRFVRDLPPEEPVAVFVRSGYMTLQLSPFTSDHAELMTAIGKAIPKLQQPGSWVANDMDTLRQMGVYLAQVPGRKNLMWFTSGSNLLLNADVDIAANAVAFAAERREVYHLLEAERIAIYPIDAKGLTVAMPNISQQMQMLQDAEATGGHAYVNTNGLALAAQHVISTDGNFYTVTYAPQGLKGNGKWHHIQVKLRTRGDALSYRRGYFDDGWNASVPKQPTRTMLKSNGEALEVPNNRSEPIVFTVTVNAIAGAPVGKGDPALKRGKRRYVVRYIVPARDVFSAKVQQNVRTVVMGSAVLAFDQIGDLVARRMQQVTLSVNEAKEKADPDASLQFTDIVDLPKGQNYLYLAVWDMVTRRMGTINAEVDVSDPKRR